MFGGMIGEAGDCETCRGELPQDGSNAQVRQTHALVLRTAQPVGSRQRAA